MVLSFMEGWPIEEEHIWNPNLLYQLEVYNQMSKKDSWRHQWLEEVEVLLRLKSLGVEKWGNKGASSELSPTFWGGQVHSTCAPIPAMMGANFLNSLVQWEILHETSSLMKPQHDYDHLAKSLQISAITGYEVHRKTTNDHTYPERSPTAWKVAYYHWWKCWQHKANWLYHHGENRTYHYFKSLAFQGKGLLHLKARVRRSYKCL